MIPSVFEDRSIFQPPRRLLSWFLWSKGGLVWNLDLSLPAYVMITFPGWVCHLRFSLLCCPDSRWIFTWLPLCHSSDLSLTVNMPSSLRELPSPSSPPFSRSHSITSLCFFSTLHISKFYIFLHFLGSFVPPLGYKLSRVWAIFLVSHGSRSAP